MDAEQARTAMAGALSLVAPEVDLSTVDPDAELRQELELDSLDFLNVVQRLQDLTGIRVDEDDYGQLESLSSSIRFLVQRSAGVAS